jgi:hypothetical protein
MSISFLADTVVAVVPDPAPMLACVRTWISMSVPVNVTASPC